MRTTLLAALFASAVLFVTVSPAPSEAHAPSLHQAHAVAKRVAKRLVHRGGVGVSAVRAKRTRSRRTRIDGCIRKPHVVRCRLFLWMSNRRVCRVAKVAVRFGGSSRRVTDRYHTRRVSCAAARRVLARRKPKPSPAPTPEPAPAPAPIPAPERLYSADSVWNTPISASAPTDPFSKAMVAEVVAEVGASGWSIATMDWTNTIYYADASTPRYDIPVTNSAWAGRKLLNVPIPTGAVPSPDSDSGMVVIDTSTGCEYDLGRLQKQADGSWLMWWGNGLPTNGTGIYPYAEAPSASGFASAAGTIRPHELQRGLIDHALAFTVKATKAGGRVLPATGSDGRSTLAGAIPEGARLQLDPNLDLDALGLAPHEKVIARALQVYGMFLVDTGGAMAIRVQNGNSTDYQYPWGRQRGYVPPVLAQHLRVIETGPQYPTTWRFVTNQCAAMSPK